MGRHKVYLVGVNFAVKEWLVYKLCLSEKWSLKISREPNVVTETHLQPCPWEGETRVGVQGRPQLLRKCEALKWPLTDLHCVDQPDRKGAGAGCLCPLSAGIQVLCCHIQWGLVLSETVSHCVAQANLRLVVFRPQPPGFQDYRFLPLYSAEILDSIDFINIIFTSNLKCSGRKTNFFLKK